MKYILILILIFVTTIGILIAFRSIDKSSPPPVARKVDENPSPNEEIAEKALFTIFTNGTMRTFADTRYHNKSEKIYITSEFPYLIHVEKAGLKWKDFFTTLPMKLEKNCLTTGTGQVFCSDNTRTLKFYINGTRDNNALDMVIKRNDRLLVTFGPNEDPSIQSQLEVLNSY